jgi:putative aldouronate transport system substrate-binding protein
MRAVKTNPVFLTGADKDLIIFFQRDVRTHNAMRFLTIAFGSRGVAKSDDKYQLFLTKDNKIMDIRLTETFYKNYTYMSEIYSEGLILKDYDQPRGKIEDFRTYCFQTNDGFMTFDYAASTVAKHDLIPKEDLAKFGTVFEPVVPPAQKWFSDKFEQYAESNRSIKPDGGWGIVSTTTGDVLEAALLLVDYPFSEDGLEVMTFGPKGLYWNEYTTVAGQKVPKLIPQFYQDNLKQTQGNWSNFMRGFVGSTLPLGHVKNTIAIETQISNEHYSNGIERINASAMTLASLSSDVPYERRLAPAMVPLTEDHVQALSLNTYVSYFIEWESRLIKFGFGSSMGKNKGKTPTIDEFKEEMKKRGLQQMIDIFNLAYEKVK